jgi:dihydrofolate synthase/folylpolyglutamate synthase
MEYKNALKYIYSLEKFGIRLGLDNVTKLLELLGNPHNSYKTIHVGGTNGKGSVVAMCSSILIEAGYRVGMYISPYLVNFGERIQVNGKYISRKELVDYFVKVKKQADYLEKKGIQITYFEFVTAMAFLYFRDKKVDFAVIEVGMGGRLDATNVIKPMVSVITNIGLEHTDYLGSTKIQIAGEKAGIIKENSILVTAEQDPKIKKIFRTVCIKRNTKYLSVMDNYSFYDYSIDLDWQQFKVRGKVENYAMKIGLLGKHQIINAMTVIAVIEELILLGIVIRKKDILKGLEKAKWPGRLEIVNKNPLVILDCAHNPHGMQTLVDFLKELRYARMILVLGISSDKDIPEIVKMIVPFSDKLIITQAKYRGAEPKILEKEARKYAKGIVAIKDVRKAVKEALKSAKKGDVVIVTGSIFTVSEARMIWYSSKE